MDTSLQLHAFEWKDLRMQVYVPDPAAVRLQYRQRQEGDPDVPFPYWAQVWPAAISLARFIVEHPQYVAGRRVLELAAGLGLPSLVAARYAAGVLCSDAVPEAVDTARRSAALNGLEGVQCAVLDWNHLPEEITADVLLLSDVNYEPAAFEALYRLLTGFLEKGTAVLLSTPQRLLARPFVERLLPWCVHQEEKVIEREEGSLTVTSVLVLRKL